MAQDNNLGKVQSAPIVEEMKRSYLDYAMSVIVSRALPDVKDGLKPVQRRIIYAMHQQGLHHVNRHQKSAAVVGEVLKNYHPHGDVPVYEALVRMAQSFSMRYTLVDGQGNFGSVDGDAPAAMRYCLTGSSMIVTSQGLISIKDVSPSKSEDISIKVLSENRAVNSASKWFDSGKQPTIKITTRQGFSLQGTHNHPIRVWSVNQTTGKPQLQWKLLDQVKTGDITVLDRTPDLLWPTRKISLSVFKPSYKNRRIETKKLPKTLNNDLAFILGSLVSEGTLSEKKLEFCNSDLKWISEFEKCWLRTFPNCRLHKFNKKPSSYGKKPYRILEIHSLYVIEFLKNLGLSSSKSPSRIVPFTILRSPKTVVSSFLQAYFEGDGSVSFSGKMNELSCCSVSQELVQQLQILLLRFGILATHRFDKYRNTHKLYLRGLRNYQLFQQQISFLYQRKNDKLKALISNLQKDSSILDYVPYLRDYVYAQLDHTLPYRSTREFTYKHNFDRLAAMQSSYQRVIPSVTSTLQPEIQKLFEQLITNHYIFDPVIKVENGGIEQVYSLRVNSSCHSFIANGFINHNTEARLAAISDELLRDINKETVDFIDNYSGTTQEPTVLPSSIPNLLLNGASGIAVGMATQIPTHNLAELVDGLMFMIDHQTKPAETAKVNGQATSSLHLAKFSSDATVEDLMKFIKGPDFPTGSSIYDSSEIVNAYATGRGRVVMRAKAAIEEGKGGRFDIIISELPYQVNKATLVTRIADLHKEKKIEGIVDLRDESDRTGMRVVVELKRDAKPQSVLNNLYKYTAMQSVFNVNMVALVDGVPHLLPLKFILEEFVSHRQVVITRRSEFELKEAKAKEHILEGLKIAVDHIDAVIQTIRSSRDADQAKVNLIAKFKLTDLQAQAILDMQLRRLAALERQKIEDELKMIRETITYLLDLLSHPEKILSVIKEELIKIKEKYGDERKTRVYKQKVGEFSEEDLVADETTIVTITENGYIKRQQTNTFRVQNRGGKGVSGITTKEADAVSHIFYTGTLDNILFFTDKGRVFQLKVWEVPEASRIAKGQAIVNLINVEQGEKITAILTLTGGKKSKKENSNFKYLFMCTRRGVVKKTQIEEFAAIRKNGLIAINLDSGDTLGWVCPSSGEDELIIVSRYGLSIRFSEQQTRATHRDTSGVRGILLNKNDNVVSLNKINDAKTDLLLVVTSKGLGKKTLVSSWNRQSRGGKGVWAAQVTDKTGSIVAAQIINSADQMLVMTSNKGQLIKLSLKDVPILHRQTQGVILMRMRVGEMVAAATVVSASDKESDGQKSS